MNSVTPEEQRPRCRRDAEYDAYEFFGGMAKGDIIMLALSLFGQQVVVESPTISQNQTSGLEERPAQIGGTAFGHGRCCGQL